MKFGLVSKFEGIGKVFHGNLSYMSGTITGFSGTLYFVFLNYGPEECAIEAQFS